MGMYRVGGLVKQGRDNLRRARGKQICLVIEDAMDDATIGYLLRVRLDGIEDRRSSKRVRRITKDVSNTLIDRNGGFILLVILDKGIAR